MEVYADEIRDLLRLSDTPRASNVVIRESPSRGTYTENSECVPTPPFPPLLSSPWHFGLSMLPST